MPDPRPDIVYFLSIWNKVIRCFHWCAGAMAAFRTGLNWADVETVLRLEKVKTGPKLMQMLRTAEGIVCEDDTRRMKK